MQHNSLSHACVNQQVLPATDAQWTTPAKAIPQTVSYARLCRPGMALSARLAAWLAPLLPPACSGQSASERITTPSVVYSQAALKPVLNKGRSASVWEPTWTETHTGCNALPGSGQRDIDVRCGGHRRRERWRSGGRPPPAPHGAAVARGEDRGVRDRDGRQWLHVYSASAIHRLHSVSIAAQLVYDVVA